MSKNSKQMLFVSLVAVISVFFGIELASRGVERINGPFPVTDSVSTAIAQPVQQPSSGSTPNNHPPLLGHDQATAAGPKTLNKIDGALVVRDSTINRIANKTGDLLQIFAYHGIRIVVSIFDKLMS